MKKFRKSISGLLAFVMLCSAFVCNMAVTASAAELTTIQKGETKSYDWTNKNMYSSSTENFGDEFLEISNKPSYNGDHGLALGSNTTFKFSVAGDATITVSRDANSGQAGGKITAKVDNGNGTITPPEGYDLYPGVSCDTVNFTYSGSGDSITVTVPIDSSGQKQTYIHGLTIAVKGEAKEITPMPKGETKSYNFVGNSEYEDTIASGMEKLSSDGLIKFTGGSDGSNISYNEYHGLKFTGSTSTISFIVPGNAKITYGGCMYTESDPLTATATEGSITPGQYDIKGTDKNGNIKEGDTLVFTYNGPQATITLTFPNQSYIHSLSIETEAEAGTGESFTYWLEGTSGYSSAVESINNGDISTDGGNITLYTDFSKSTKNGGKITVDGTEHAIYATTSGNKKGNGTTSALPTDGTAMGFTPTNNGIAVLYYYTPATKSVEIYGGKDGSYSQLKSGDETGSCAFNVNNGTTYFFQTLSTSDLALAGIKFIKNDPVDVSITINDNGVTVGESDKVIFTDKETGDTVEVSLNGQSTTASLLKGHTYTILSSNPAIDAKLTGDVTEITIDGTPLTINLKDVPDSDLSGTITFEDNGININDIESISFKSKSNPSYTVAANISTDDSTYTVNAIKPGDYDTVAQLMSGKTDYITSDHVSVAVEKSTTKNEIYFYNPNKEIAAATKKEIIVGTGEGADYKTLTEALAAIKKMTRSEDESSRVTITLNSDLTEQVHIDVPYITLKGGNHTIDWYYGMLGAYYSVDPTTGYYSEPLFRDKYKKSVAKSSFWGGVVIVDAPHFIAEDVTFKNTYNYKVTDKEKEDGAYVCTLEGNNVVYDEAEKKGYLRSTVDDPTVYDQKERANALALSSKSDCAEFYKVNILSSQDTLGWNGAHTAKAYFKECTIGGNVDYICGAGNLFFDNCTLELYGYKDKGDASYITAAQATKYLFMNCTITGNDNDNPTKATAYYGRPWKDGADVKFVNTTDTQGRIVDAGWIEWKPGDGSLGSGKVNYAEYANSRSGEAFTSTAVNTYDGVNAMTDEQYNTLVKNIPTDFFNSGWTPIHYAPSIVDTTDGTNSVNAKLDGTNLVIYAAIDAGSEQGASNIGFVLSTVDNLVKLDREYTDTKVYDEIQPSSGDAITEEGKYLFAYVVEGVSSDTLGGAEKLYVRTLQKTDGETVYGPAKTFDLNALTASN